MVGSVTFEHLVPSFLTLQVENSYCTDCEVAGQIEPLHTTQAWGFVTKQCSKVLRIWGGPSIGEMSHELTSRSLLEHLVETKIAGEL